MSLTQERINEIALEVAHRTAKTYRHKADEPYGFDEDCMIHAFNRFLSRIREEQEAVAWAKCWKDSEYYELSQFPPTRHSTDQFCVPLFTTPPATLPSGNSTESDCKELVEASIKIKDYLESSACMIVGFDIPDDIYVPFCKSLANHAKRTKAGEE